MSANQLSLETLIAILILLFYTISAPLFEKYHFHYMHESGICMIIGIAITLVAMLISPEHNFAKSLKFDSEIFFTFILPPIIFAAGYNLRRRSFFKYFLYIFLYGVVGTIVTFSIVCPLTYIANKNKLFSVSFGKEIEDIALMNHTIENEITVVNNQIRHLNFEGAIEEYVQENYTKSNFTGEEEVQVNPSGNNNENKDENIPKEIIATEIIPKEIIPKEIIPTDNISTDNIPKEIIPKEIIPTDNIPTDIVPPTEAHDEFLLNFSFREILLFSSVISATDTVAALTFIKEESEPKLFAILFGEGVINDAVCIVLYGIIRDFTASNEEFTGKTPLKMFGSFMNMFFFSFLVGAIVGCSSSIFLKKSKSIRLNRVQECSIIIFFAFISYTLTEEMGLSPIIALLFTGIFMSHYSFYNLSFQAREESSVVSRIMSNIAEAFVFTYLGLTVIHSTTMAFSINFFIWELIFVVLGRFIAIYGISYVMGLLNINSFRLKKSQKGIMSCAGSIRGAIAFGLAISIDTSNRINKEVLISSTLMLVLFSTIVFGALMPMFIKFFSSLDHEETNEVDNHYIELGELNQGVEFDYLHPNFSQDLVGASKEKDENKLKQRLSYWLGTYWIDFDNVYMKPKLIHNWPAVKSEHDDISKIIKDVIKNFKTGKDEHNQENNDNNFRKQFEVDHLDGKCEIVRNASRDEIMYGNETK